MIFVKRILGKVVGFVFKGGEKMTKEERLQFADLDDYVCKLKEKEKEKDDCDCKTKEEYAAQLMLRRQIEVINEIRICIYYEL